MPRIGAAGKQAVRKGPKAHQLASEFPKGLFLTDVFKKDWQLGDVIGQGGFGLIYLASRRDPSTPVTKATAENVIKIEPKDNGPLFCEINFYQRAGKENDIKEFATKHKLHYLSVPPYVSAGIHKYQSKDYRFLVMPRFGTDLQHLLRSQGGTFPPQAVFAVGLRMIDALEYIHEKNFVHADIKAGNILMGYKNGKVENDQVYLVDFGLATKYKDDTGHRPYKEDPRKAHNGTIEFTSRDAHKGLEPSRRGDIEILGYCLLQWLCGRLPWESDLTNPNTVASGKEKYMQSVPKLVSTCFSRASPITSAHASTIQSFLEEVNKLQYDSQPNYTMFRRILGSGLTKAGQKNEWRIEFTSKSKSPSKRKSGGAGDMASPSPVKRSRVSSPKKQPAPQCKSTVKKQSASKQKPSASPSKNPRSPKKTALPVASRAKSPKSLSLPVASTSARSLASGRSPSVPKAVGRPKVNGTARQEMSLPVPSKSTAKSPRGQTQSTSTKRKVRRVKTVQSDAAIQTSPNPR